MLMSKIYPVLKWVTHHLLLYLSCRIPREHLQSAPAAYNRRLYQQDGMIPKYTGYIPRKYIET